MAEFLRVVFVIVLILISGAAAATVGIKLIQAPIDIVGSLEACRFLTAAIGAENAIAGTTVNVIRQRCSTEYTIYPGSGRIVDTVQVKRHFAESARKVWWAVGEGAVKELWNDEKFDAFGGNDCVTLSLITYDSSVSKRHNFSGSELSYFFLTEGFEKGEEFYTYMGYVTGAYSGEPGAIFIDPQLEIKPGETYGFAVTSKNEGWLKENGKWVAAGAAGVATVAAALLSGGLSLVVETAVVSTGVAAGVSSWFLGSSTYPPTFMVFDTKETLENEWDCFDIAPKGGT